MKSFLYWILVALAIRILFGEARKQEKRNGGKS